MRSEMSLLPLNEIGKIVKRAIMIDPNKEYKTVGCKLYGLGVYERETKRGSEIAASKMFLIQGNDFLINRIWAQKGSAGIVPPKLDGAIVTNDFPVIQLDITKVHPPYISWYVKTKNFWEECREHSRGTSGRERLIPNELPNVEIPLPSLDEQKRIVARIESLMDRVEEARRFRGEIDKDIRSMLIGAYLKIIEEAKYLLMAEVAPLVRRPVQIEISKQYYELGVRSFGKGTFHKPAIDGIAVGTKKIYRIEEGDLIFNNVFAWEGAVAVVKSKDHDRVGSHRFITCVSHEGVITSPFLCFHFLTNGGLEQLGAASPGGAGRNRTLGIKKLENIRVPVPSIGKQIWFDSIQAKVDELKKLQTETEKEVEQLIPSILDKAFKGDL